MGLGILQHKNKITFDENNVTVERENGDFIELYYNDEGGYRINLGLEEKKYSQLELICLTEKILEFIKQQ